MSTFTTARVTAGVIVRRELHRKRLLLDGGEPQLVDGLLQEADDRAATLAEGMVRVVLGDGREGSSVESGPARRALWRAGDPPLSLLLRADPRSGAALFRKTVERGALDRLDDEARAIAADGVLLQAPDGGLREGTWFSFWLFLDGAWCAPPVGEGVLYSTTREAARRALASRGAPLVERPLGLRELCRAEGAAALSSLLGASAVWRVGDVVFERSPFLVAGLLVDSNVPS